MRKIASDQDDVLSKDFTASAGEATYKIVTDIDRRLTEAGQSTQTHTVLTFTSAENGGQKLPMTWTCDAGTDCRVMPLLLAHLTLQTNLNGQLPAGRSTVTLRLNQAQGATSSPITAASLHFRPVGHYDHRTVMLHPIGGDKYQGAIDNTDLPGLKADIFITAKDKAGSTVTQTIATPTP